MMPSAHEPPWHLYPSHVALPGGAPYLSALRLPCAPHLHCSPHCPPMCSHHLLLPHHSGAHPFILQHMRYLKVKEELCQNKIVEPGFEPSYDRRNSSGSAASASTPSQVGTLPVFSPAVPFLTPLYMRHPDFAVSHAPTFSKPNAHEIQSCDGSGLTLDRRISNSSANSALPGSQVVTSPEFPLTVPSLTPSNVRPPDFAGTQLPTISSTKKYAPLSCIRPVPTFGDSMLASKNSTRQLRRPSPIYPRPQKSTNPVTQVLEVPYSNLPQQNIHLLTDNTPRDVPNASDAEMKLIFQNSSDNRSYPPHLNDLPPQLTQHFKAGMVKLCASTDMDAESPDDELERICQEVKNVGGHTEVQEEEENEADNVFLDENDPDKALKLKRLKNKKTARRYRDKKRMRGNLYRARNQILQAKNCELREVRDRLGLILWQVNRQKDDFRQMAVRKTLE